MKIVLLERVGPMGYFYDFVLYSAFILVGVNVYVLQFPLGVDLVKPFRKLVLDLNKACLDVICVLL